MQNARLIRGTWRLKWERDYAGYKIVEHPTFTEHEREAILRSERGKRILALIPTERILPSGGPRTEYQIELGEAKERVFLDLLKMEESKEGILGFANKWGCRVGKVSGRARRCSIISK
jgi:hypothetical protein